MTSDTKPRTQFEVTFACTDPAIAETLREIERMPRDESRLMIEALLMQWLAAKWIRDAGRMEGREAAFAHNRRRKATSDG